MPYEFTNEPRWCIEALIKAVKFEGKIHDPACGTGEIPSTFIAHGFSTTASDIAYRGYPPSCIHDFLEFDYVKAEGDIGFDNIVTNPPYTRSEEFIRRGLLLTEKRLAVLARITFLSSQKRYKLTTENPPEKVVILSRRPSMPTGGFCWIVWN